jgi:hypothetical protein
VAGIPSFPNRRFRLAALSSSTIDVSEYGIARFRGR